MLLEFEIFLKNNLPKVESFHPNFNLALSEMLSAKAKRFRPLLLLSVVENSSPLLLKNSMHVALAVEMFHTYSLIHDDLPAMDNACLRRGNETLHIKYDETTAILVGDALNSHSFYMITNAPLSDEIKVKLISILARDGGINGMIIGQAIDCKFENKKLSLEQLKFMHVNKTAKLIAASLLMGAIIGGLCEKKQQSIYNFGLKLGLLFQIQDDIIDITQSSDQAGKSTMSDVNKNSFINLLGIKGANDEKSRLLKELEIDTNSFKEDLSQCLRKIINNYFKG
ncbi:MAG: polyprenyl synthetase family protein [Sulfurospirillum sp.]|nr:polyprenyl synthetase family protein [Sulfurospirillum sp.]MBL0702779.1 polyprenyl synthetase family protein [Sulfurospirillum sp.]